MTAVRLGFAKPATTQVQRTTLRQFETGLRHAYLANHLPQKLQKGTGADSKIKTTVVSEDRPPNVGGTLQLSLRKRVSFFAIPSKRKIPRLPIENSDTAPLSD
jgi:hypothetical protein